MPAVVADPPRWRGEDLATLSALSIATGRRRVYRGYLKAPDFFPCFCCTAEILQGRRKKRLSEKKVPLITKKLPFRAYFY